MLILVAVGVITSSVILAGGRLTRLAELRVRWSALLFTALGLQILIISVVPHWPAALLAVVHLGTYALAGAFVVVNRAIPGLWLIAVGGFSNLLAIAANGGVMPATPAALQAAGRAPADGWTNSAAVADAKLQLLGDVFAVPHGWPLANVFSVGDVLIVVGLAVALHRICSTRLVPSRFRWMPPEAAGAGA